jgi:hypothetical protein
MPVPPRADRLDAPRLFARAPAFRRSCIERFFFPFGVLALAAFRPVLRRAAEARRVAALLRADARAPEPVRVFDGVRFRPLLEPFREELPAFRRAVFFAIVLDPCL